MAQLDEVLRMINARRQAKQQPDQNDEMSKLISSLSIGYMRPQDFNDALATLASAVSDLQKVSIDLAQKVDALSQTAGSLVEEVGKKPDSLDPAISAVDSIKASLQKLTTAISGIRIDIPRVDIPEPQEVDLSPIKAELSIVREMVAALAADEMEPETETEVEKPKSWVFDIKRNRGGYIKSIEAREV